MRAVVAERARERDHAMYVASLRVTEPRTPRRASVLALVRAALRALRIRRRATAGAGATAGARPRPAILAAGRVGVGLPLRCATEGADQPDA